MMGEACESDQDALEMTWRKLSNMTKTSKKLNNHLNMTLYWVLYKVSWLAKPVSLREGHGHNLIQSDVKGIWTAG